MTKITPIDHTPAYDLPPGPIEGRSCRDVFWLLLFAAYWAGMIILAILSIVNGNPNRILLSRDSSGQYCGSSNSDLVNGRDLSGKPNLFYFDPTNPSARQVCVAQCPDSTTVPTYAAKNYICDETVPTNQATLLAAQNDGTCARVLYRTESVLNRCLPISDLVDAINLGLNGQSGTSTNQVSNAILTEGLNYVRILIQDFVITWKYMLAALGVCMVVCFIWLLLLRFLAGFLTWVTLIALEAGFVALCWYTWGLWQAKKQTNSNLSSPSSSDSQAETINLALFIASACLGSIFLLIIIALRKRIAIAIQVIKQASKAIFAMPLIVTFPLVTYVGILVLTAYYVIIAIFIETTNDTTDFSAIGVNYTITYIKYFQWYHLLGFLWTLAFLVAINQTTIAGAIATWYWSHDKSNLPDFPVIRSFWRTIRYSLGSLALGSLLIAITQFIRIVLIYIQKQLRGSTNKIATTVLTCLHCCFACLERFLKFLNKNAYIMIAVNGTSFCTSARQALELLVRNAFRLLAVDFVSTFIIVLSKLLVAGGTAAGLYVYLNYTNSIGLTATQAIWVVALVVGLAAWMIVSCFFGVYRMGIDTVFLSFCEDCERNDGSAERPYYMDEDLACLLSIKSVGAPQIARELRTSDQPKPRMVQATKKSVHY